MMDSSVRRAAGSANTRRRIAGRSNAPCASRTPGPKASTTSTSPSLPTDTASRAATSASATVTPSAAQRSASALFPEATPPVSPTTNPLMRGRLRQAGEAQVGVDDPVAPEEDDPAGDRQVPPERDRLRAVAALGRQPRRADDRAHQRGQQDGRQDAGQPHLGPDRRDQLVVAVSNVLLAGELLEQP